METGPSLQPQLSLSSSMADPVKISAGIEFDFADNAAFSIDPSAEEGQKVNAHGFKSGFKIIPPEIEMPRGKFLNQACSFWPLWQACLTGVIYRQRSQVHYSREAYC